jgi:hypothetical protein
MTRAIPQLPQQLQLQLQLLLLSIWTVGLLVVPIWWKTTEVHRAPIPVARIDEWADPQNELQV